MDINITKLIEVIRKTAEAIVPGAPAMIEAGEALLDFVQDVAPTLANSDQGELRAALPALLEKMDRDVDQAVKDLGG